MNGTELHLHARIFRTGTTWYADIDDPVDPVPEAPLWYGQYESQKAAIDAACERLAAYHLPTPQQHLSPHHFKG
ncbi:hypothetical protein Kfla_1760 [Kribbella flavida DSM 17836]|uniref:DUF2188 domain-containing protein n=1 Tax=Kribbella flavida (strain DSM 17836 / JCM 10339 / NBRC 14399) TaxID=479435 RepID=D2PNK3_KRIFD|nr:hypothetical protein [Kribbella flavida]ADB30855.1 hypothetical protein Kfla_1760 [Kribbella flavida DSM 17836]